MQQLFIILANTFCEGNLQSSSAIPISGTIVDSRILSKLEQITWQESEPVDSNHIDSYFRKQKELFPRLKITQVEVKTNQIFTGDQKFTIVKKIIWYRESNRSSDQ